MTKWVSAQSMRLKWRGFASNLTDSSKWELRELSELYEEVKELLDDASDGHAFPEEVAEAKHSAEEFLHRYERFVVNLDDDEKVKHRMHCIH